ncbi:hypothetical protein REPUB_Repub04eG0168500 [Reevesia pubescens]
MTMNKLFNLSPMTIGGVLLVDNVVVCTGVNSRNESINGNNLSGSSSRVSSASIPQTPRSEDEILQSSNLKTFTFGELRTATRNFRPNNVLGEGGFGSIFKGWIDKHSLTTTKPGTSIVIAFKTLSQEGFQGYKEWLLKLTNLGQLHHLNPVKLIGYCLEDEHRLLGLHFPPLSWGIRMKVELGATKGLAFLHNAKPQVIYRDFKTSNILHDLNYDAKLSDFGLARDGPIGDKSHVSTRVMGTYRYAAPEYLATGVAPSPVFFCNYLVFVNLFGLYIYYFSQDAL